MNAEVVNGSLPRRSRAGRGALLATAALLASIAAAQSQQTGNIVLQGAIASNCNITVTTTSQAGSLTLSDGAQHIQVGTVNQSCNKKAGYKLTVASANCATGTAGAKLVGGTGGETLGYSVEFDNPTTGGSSATVTGLLQSACSGAAPTTGRSVASSKISNENSTVWANFSGNSGLGADTYSDTLTVTMTVN